MCYRRGPCRRLLGCINTEVIALFNHARKSYYVSTANVHGPYELIRLYAASTLIAFAHCSGLFENVNEAQKRVSG